MPKQPSESRDTRKIIARLQREGWVIRGGKGDHVNLCKDGIVEIITIDMGEKTIKQGIFQRIKRIARWK